MTCDTPLFQQHTPEQKKLYKKHHKIRGSLVTAIPKAEYMKMSDKSTTKVMFASLCANYEGSKKVREAKALMLVDEQNCKCTVLSK